MGGDLKNTREIEHFLIKVVMGLYSILLSRNRRFPNALLALISPSEKLKDMSSVGIMLEEDILVLVGGYGELQVLR